MISEKALAFAQNMSEQLFCYADRLGEFVCDTSDGELTELVYTIYVGAKAVRLLLKNDEETINMFERHGWKV